MHPPHNCLYAQNLVAEVYNSLRSNEELWKNTLFLVTCDEGVGVFDHVPPPAAPDPKAGYKHQYYGQDDPRSMKRNPFTRYGTRVPLLMASPLIEAGSVVRPSEEFSEYPFDHTSIIRTVFDLFVDPSCSLTNRDKLAPSFAPYLLQQPRASGLGPEKVQLDRPVPPWVDHQELRPNNPARGGCHSLHHLTPNPEGDVVETGETPAGLQRFDTGAAMGGNQGQMLASMGHLTDLLANFGKVNGVRDVSGQQIFHWLAESDSESDDGTESGSGLTEESADFSSPP